MTIDGRVAVLGDRADAAYARVAIDGTPLPVRPDLVYILLNKPQDVVSTAADTHGRHTVVDLVVAPHRVFPVGRLDAASEGLMILTKLPSRRNWCSREVNTLRTPWLIRYSLI